MIANLKFNLINRESLVSPFLQLGIGFYRFSSEASISYFESESTVTFGEVRTAAIWMFGGGLDYNLNELLTLFIYTDYRIGYSDNIQTNYLPISFGVSLHL